MQASWRWEVTNSKQLLRGALWCHAQELELLPAGSTLVASHHQVVYWIYFISEGKSTNFQRTVQVPHNSPMFLYTHLLGNTPHSREQSANHCPYLRATERVIKAGIHYGGKSQCFLTYLHQPWANRGQPVPGTSLTACRQPLGLSWWTLYSDGPFF